MTGRVRHDESGFALLTAILVIVVLGIIISLVLGVASMTSREVAEQSHRSSAVLVAEGAAQSIAQALQAQGDVLGDALDITPSVIRTAATLSGANVLDGNGGYAFPTGANATPEPLRFTIVDDRPGYRTAWQVLRIVSPDIAATPPRSYVTVLIRAWTGSTSGANRPAIIKANYRPGTFVDYQVISDMSIAFQAGTNITGSVHTNGFIDDTMLPPGSDQDRIWSTGGSVNCTTPPSGRRPVISSARGHIVGVSTGSCTVRETTDESISLARVASSFRAMQANCGVPGSGVTCYQAPASAPLDGAYSLNLTTMSVSAPWGVPAAAAANASGGRALLFDRDVRVSGTSRGRVSIGTRTTNPAISATDIHIVGDTAAATPAINAQNSLALMAENDIVFAGCTVTNVRAALVAGTGAVTIPRELRNNLLTTGAAAMPAPCANVSLTGSIASHGSIILRWHITGATVGYTNRTYAWDPWLAYYPPPFVPLAHPWEISGLEAVSGDCFAPAAGSAPVELCT